MSNLSTAWMNQGRINKAIRIFESLAYTSHGDAKDAAEEGLACLKDAKPEYLVNLIQQDHPDRIYAKQLLEENW